MDKRHLVQALWAAATNSYLKGFASAKIYGGKLKFACVPGLSCSSCPGALGTCPIGALQSVLDSGKFKFSCYCFGFLMLVGALCGRFACGWLCPFGLVQDLLDKIPARKIRTFKGDKPLRYLKYAVLVVLVLLLPMLITNVIGQGEPWFCKWALPFGHADGRHPVGCAGFRAALHNQLALCMESVYPRLSSGAFHLYLQAVLQVSVPLRRNLRPVQSFFPYQNKASRRMCALQNGLQTK